MLHDTSECVQNYLLRYPQEKENLGLLLSQLEHESGESLLSRKNYTGHITASAFVINIEKLTCLMVEHVSLGKMLQPGGHIEVQDASLLKAAMREVQEETGLKNIAPLLDSEGTPILLDIDTHFIPRNLKKQEEEHYHHDFRYLFYSTKDDAGVANKQEVQSVTYIPITLLNDTLHTDKNLASKIYAYISDTHTLRRNYWHEILNYRDNCEVKFVCVSHIIPSSRAMIECLHENDLLLGVLAKPNSINNDIWNYFCEKGIMLEKLIRGEGLFAILEAIIGKYPGKFAIIDIGGYMVDIARNIFDTYGERCIGFIEDTENGLQKYEKTIASIPYPIISLARDELKENEDYLIGNSIVFSLEDILRKNNEILQGKKCGVIGFGKIGFGTAMRLRAMSNIVYVSDINPKLQIRAKNFGFGIRSTKEIIKTCDIVFCATGSKSLGPSEFRKTKTGLLIVSATSADDEFDLRFLGSEYIASESTYFRSTHYRSRGTSFTLIHDGKSVNFLHDAVVGEYILLVQAGLVLAAQQILEAHYNNEGKIITLDIQKRDYIYSLWLYFFGKYSL